MDFNGFKKLFRGRRFPNDLSKQSLQLLLIGLGYLHRCNVVHTDISPNNMLLGIEDNSILAKFEQDELDLPIARKTLSGRTIYNSRPLPVTKGEPVICDLGEARIGNQKHKGDIMPGIYRAPEVILGMEWDSKVDIWAMGVVTWDFVADMNLFFAVKDRMLNDEQHLAEMVSLLGPPPLEFLERSEKCNEFWDS